MRKFLKELDYRHYICAAITLVCFACGFLFPYAGERLLEGFRDFGTSIAYYFDNLLSAWTKGEYVVTTVPTVMELTDVPFVPLIDFPKTFQLFKDNWWVFWELFFTLENVIAYGIRAGDVFFVIYQFSFLILPTIGVGSFLINKILSIRNSDDNKDSFLLIKLKRFSDIAYRPTKQFLFKFWEFVRGTWWLKTWIIVWLFYFNVFTIVVEFLAFYIYLCFSRDILGIFLQIHKLFLDLSVPLRFIPGLIWFVIVVTLLNKLSYSRGYDNLYHNELKNNGFMGERGVSNIIDGSMGSGKTLLGTDMALTYEVRMRNLAYEVILESDLMFPFFPWINLERELKAAFEKHEIFSVPSCRRWLREKYKGYRRKRCSERIFGYDIHRYPTKYNNELEIKDVWEVLDDYSCAYLVYTVQSSLMIANYSIRTDHYLMDMGNFPVWNTDFFKRDPRLQDSLSKHAHILDWDMLRLGKIMLERNPNRFAFGFGVYVITELNQERKNSLTLKELRADSKECNQKNDLLEVMIKLGRHPCVIANRVFVIFIADLQRTGDLSSSLLEVGEVIHIASVGKFVPVLPFWAPFWIFEIASKIFMKFYNKIHEIYRINRSDNTVFMHVLKKITFKINNYVVRKNNLFNTRVVKLELESGKLNGVTAEHKYYESSKKIFSRRYATDAHAGIFDRRARYNEVGINDLREYLTHRASDEELLLQHSFMQADMIKYAS